LEKSSSLFEKVLRNSFAVILLYRFGIIIFTEQYYFGEQAFPWTDLILLLSIAWIIWGRILPVGYIILNAAMIKFDHNHNTGTLGTTVACMTSFSLLANYLLIKPSESKLNFITVADKWSRKALKKYTSPRFLHLYAFFTYAISSFCAQLFHLEDQTWLEGKTLQEMLTSSYICRFHSPFVFIEDRWPLVLYGFSLIGVIGQSIFQLSIPFALFSSRIRAYTIIWGWVFIISCLIFIQLSYLPLIEVILWISLFHGKSGFSVKTNLFKKLKHHIYKYKLSTIISGLLVGSFLFFNFDIPKIGIVAKRLGIASPISITQYAFFGLEIPGVFNETDLKMSDHWMTLYRYKKPILKGESLSHLKNLDIQISKDIELVPITKPSGEKDYYQQSDLLYFGNTLKYRRFLNYMTPQEAHEDNSLCTELIKSRVYFDYSFNNIDKPMAYIGIYHERDPSDKSSSNEVLRFAYIVNAKREISILDLN
jgi:hypothetical protein